MIIGRKEELDRLNKVYKSKNAEFVAIYGRRRVGKTYLIREFFKGKKCAFVHATGLQNGTLKKQLKKFNDALSETFFDNIQLEVPNNWDEAFNTLHKQIIKTKGKVVIFLDELPWMAGRKSGLLEELDHYWNQKWSTMDNVILIVCGSSASWIIKKIINNKGGLHNRITCAVKLMPFNLHETKEFLLNRGIKLNNRHILSLYMAIGGIPYYLNHVEDKKTADQNIQYLYFSKNAPLHDEFSKLFDSLFENSDAYKELIRLISVKKEGLNRVSLKKSAKLSSGGGRLSKRLTDLCEAGFIEKYIPFGRSTGEYYKLIDEFCLFHLNWVESRHIKNIPHDFWLDQSKKPAFYVWAGYAFEAICSKHINNIIDALEIKSAINISSWRARPTVKIDKGAQIDLVIDRDDDSITLCEIKYTNFPFAIDKNYAQVIENKIEVFRDTTKTLKHIFFAIISANGLADNFYSKMLVSGGVVTLDDFFR